MKRLMLAIDWQDSGHQSRHGHALAGVYCFNTSAQLTGTLTLNGSGVYVFKMGTTLTTASNSSVVLAKGATAGNVFWQVGSSATLGTNSVLVGSISRTSATPSPPAPVLPVESLR